MEVPSSSPYESYEREREREREGMEDLLAAVVDTTTTTTTTTTATATSSSKKPLSPTSSDSSTTSCVSNDDNNFDSQQQQQQQQQHLASVEINVTVNHGTDGFHLHQNGITAVHSLHQNGRDTEMEMDVAHSSFSNTPHPRPHSAVGLKQVESLLDESSSGVIVNAENDNGVHLPEEEEEEEEEYDVERVIQKQETHDLYCPNCHSCITKRVILRRRKRKIQEISTSTATADDADQTTDQIGLPSDHLLEQTQGGGPPPPPPDSPLDAISCFSCFSIFVPTGEGFLCWRFKPKTDLSRQPDQLTLSDVGQAVDPTITDSTGTSFPLWVVTCCQPAERKKSNEPSATLGSIYEPLSEDGTEAPPCQTEPSLPPSDGLSSHDLLSPQVLHHSPQGRPHIEGLPYGVGTTLQNKPLNPMKPCGDAPSHETPSNITVDEGRNFPLWILTCCQPSMDGKKVGHPVKLDGIASAQEAPSAAFNNTKSDHSEKSDGTMLPRETSSAPSGDTQSDHLAMSDGTVPQMEASSLSALSSGTMPHLAPCDDNPIPSFQPKYPAIFVPGTSSPFKPITTTKPVNDIHGPPQTDSPAGSGGAVLQMPPKWQPPAIPSDEHRSALLHDVEPGLVCEPPSPGRGVSGLDIIKAIVYGGLLESITSLSVITSAAGADATTLNIVALALANVFGGLVVLVHNLRLLKHEHATEHYEAQLGRPGHYILHAVVAIISYLVFGLMSPIIYGFSFRKSDNKDYKLATLAAAALACITLLSAAKAYVRTPPKGYFKTVLYYISLGFMVSGLGYVAGDAINILLKKLGIFDPRAPSDVPVLINGGWSYY